MNKTKKAITSCKAHRVPGQDYSPTYVAIGHRTIYKNVSAALNIQESNRKKIYKPLLFVRKIRTFSIVLSGV